MVIVVMIVLRLDVEAQIGSAVGVNVAAGVLLLFFSFLCRGRKIGAMGARI